MIDLQNKIVFFDIEGTLGEKPKGNGENGKITIRDLVLGNCFFETKPYKEMQDLVESLNQNKIFVLGTIDTNNEINQKINWISLHFPKFKKENLIFISSEYTKADTMLCYSSQLKIQPKQMVLIDDKLANLDQAKIKGFGVIDANEILNHYLFLQ